jgi:hypothetical protein
MQARQLRRVIHREVKTYYTISEILDCGHRFENLLLAADPLIARHRACPRCAMMAGGEKKLPQSVHFLSERKAA